MMLSSFIICLALLFGLDLIIIQSAEAHLSSASHSISYWISKEERVDLEFLKSLEEKYEVSIILDQTQPHRYGDQVDFTVYDVLKPIIISNKSLKLSHTTSAIIGFYN